MLVYSVCLLMNVGVFLLLCLLPGMCCLCLVLLVVLVVGFVFLRVLGAYAGCWLCLIVL